MSHAKGSLRDRRDPGVQRASNQPEPDMQEPAAPRPRGRGRACGLRSSHRFAKVRPGIRGHCPRNRRPAADCPPRARAASPGRFCRNRLHSRPRERELGVRAASPVPDAFRAVFRMPRKGSALRILRARVLLARHGSASTRARGLTEPACGPWLLALKQLPLEGARGVRKCVMPQRCAPVARTRQHFLAVPTYSARRRP